MRDKRLALIPHHSRSSGSSGDELQTIPATVRSAVHKRSVNQDNAKPPLRAAKLKPSFECQNMFLQAIMRAAQSYSEKLRTPLGPATCAPTRLVKSHAMVNWNVESDPPNDEIDSSDDEADATAVGIMNLSVEQRMMALYKPHGRWAPYFNQPIEDAVTISKLGGECHPLVAYAREAHHFPPIAGRMCEAFIKEGTLGGNRITYISKTWVLAQNWDGFFSEMLLYSDPQYLRGLQGDVVPFIIGVYLVEGRFSVAMELPHSSFWVEASQDMPDALKEKCISAFDKIHDNGVLHGDVELRHMLINAEGNVTLIDFQMSQALIPNEEMGLGSCTADDIRLEKRKVRFKLKYRDADSYEVQKRRRVLGRQKRNERRQHELELKFQGRYTGDTTDFEEYDPEDIINPIVEPQIWMDCWCSDESDPRCVVVPGQDNAVVQTKLRKFVMAKCLPPVLRSVVTRATAPPALGSDVRKRKLSASGDATSPAPPRVFEYDATPPTKRHRASPTLAITPGSAAVAVPQQISEANRTASCALPTHRYLYRPEGLVIGQTSPDPRPTPCAALGSFSVVAPPISPRSVERPSASIPGDEEANNSSPIRGAEADPTVTASHVQETSQMPFSVGPDVIHVPYEGYDGPSGFTLPNQYGERHLSVLRRTWITQANIARCHEEGLLYPLAEKLGLTASTDGSQERRHGPTVSLGGLKRARRMLQDTGPVESLSKKPRIGDLVSEQEGAISGPSCTAQLQHSETRGPRILTADEYEARMSCLHTSAPRRASGILRARLTEADTDEQRDYERRRNIFMAEKAAKETMAAAASSVVAAGISRVNDWRGHARHQLPPSPTDAAILGAAVATVSSPLSADVAAPCGVPTSSSPAWKKKLRTLSDPGHVRDLELDQSRQPKSTSHQSKGGTQMLSFNRSPVSAHAVNGAVTSPGDEPRSCGAAMQMSASSDPTPRRSGSPPSDDEVEHMLRVPDVILTRPSLSSTVVAHSLGRVADYVGLVRRWF